MKLLIASPNQPDDTITPRERSRQPMPFHADPGNTRLLDHWRQAEQNVAARQAQRAAAAHLSVEASSATAERVRFAHD